MGRLFVLCISLLILGVSCSDDEGTEGGKVVSISGSTTGPVESSYFGDFNEDGAINILVLGTSKSINAATGGFEADGIADELTEILKQKENNKLPVNVVAEDIYTSKWVTFGLGQKGNVFNWPHYSHSLMQYYYWPEGQAKRLSNLKGEDGMDWDYVVIGADPYMVAKLPGYYALGVDKLVAKIVAGDAKPLLMMVWPKDQSIGTTAHFKEFTHRVAAGAKNKLEVVSAGAAWNALPAAKKDKSTEHPSANGAYLAAASIYAQIFNKSAANSGYSYDDEIAEKAYQINSQAPTVYGSKHTFVSPLNSCDVDDAVLNYNHTGSSSENGILKGLKWVVAKSDRTLVKNGTSPINFNYGRANTNFEPHKRYKIDASKFDFSFGFPMQDGANHGNESMLYGLDKRTYESNNSTDIGAALYMVRNNEANVRVVPIRTLYAQLKEMIPAQSAYSDSWHMHGDLDKASASYMYTILTGECLLDVEPAEGSAAWNSWMAQKIGYETAYTLMSVKGEIPSCE